MFEIATWPILKISLAVLVFRTVLVLTFIFLANMYLPIDNQLMDTKSDAFERNLVSRGLFILNFGLGNFFT